MLLLKLLVIKLQTRNHANRMTATIPQMVTDEDGRGMRAHAKGHSRGTELRLDQNCNHVKCVTLLLNILMFQKNYKLLRNGDG